jgi:hypothetical protein
MDSLVKYKDFYISNAFCIALNIAFYIAFQYVSCGVKNRKKDFENLQCFSFPVISGEEPLDGCCLGAGSSQKVSTSISGFYLLKCAARGCRSMLHCKKG